MRVAQYSVALWIGCTFVCISMGNEASLIHSLGKPHNVDVRANALYRKHIACFFHGGMGLEMEADYQLAISGS
jgi:hypothetical protein